MNTARDQVLKNLKDWARKNKDVLCVVISGSQENKSKKADEYSDIDAAVFVRRRRHYDTNLGWMREIGNTAFHYKDHTIVPGMTGIHKIYFANGVQLDLFFWNRNILTLAYVYLWIRENKAFSFFIPRFLDKIIRYRFLFFSDWIRRGYSIPAGKSRYRRKVEYINRKFRYRQASFSTEKLQEIMCVFWTFSYSCAIYIYRNELLAAKTLGDRIIKAQLLFLIELYVKCTKGQDYDVFHNGRRLEQWAPAFITERLKNIYGRYDATDAWTALMETIDLFSMICHTLMTENPDIRIDFPEEHFRKLIKGIGSKMVDAENLIS